MRKLLTTFPLIGLISTVLAVPALSAQSGFDAMPLPQAADPSAPVFERSSEAETLLLDIVLREKTLFSQLEERPDLHTDEQAQRLIDGLVEDYAYYNETYPGDAMALILHGKLLHLIGLREAAMERYLRADAIDPHIAVLKQQIGNYFVEEDQGVAALPFFFHAVELEPEEAVYHYQLGELLYHYREIFVEEGVFESVALEAAMHEAFAYAARLQPNDFDLQMRFGESFHDLSEPDWQSALSHWEQMEDRFPELIQDEIILLHKARVLVELERYSDALGALRYVRHRSLWSSRDTVLERIPQGTTAPEEED